jgi:hypothetical protein
MAPGYIKPERLKQVLSRVMRGLIDSAIWLRN